MITFVQLFVASVYHIIRISKNDFRLRFDPVVPQNVHQF